MYEILKKKWGQNKAFDVFGFIANFCFYLRLFNKSDNKIIKNHLKSKLMFKP